VHILIRLDLLPTKTMIMQRMYNSILLVEDDHDDKAIFFHALEEINAPVKCNWMQNGEEALKFLFNESNFLPECIFMDYNMPKINGLECLKTLKATERLKHIPVIALSTAKNVETQMQFKAAGANGYITKPDSYKKLVSILRFYLVMDNVLLLK
jgi:CheY-like chemotaxis protein